MFIDIRCPARKCGGINRRGALLLRHQTTATGIVEVRCWRCGADVKVLLERAMSGSHILEGFDTELPGLCLSTT